MERIDLVNIVKLLSDDALRAVLMDIEADSLTDCPPDFGDLIENALHGQKGFAQMDSQELQDLVVDSFIDEEEDVAEVVELLDAHAKSGKHWVDTVAAWREGRKDE